MSVNDKSFVNIDFFNFDSPKSETASLEKCTYTNGNTFQLIDVISDNTFQISKFPISTQIHSIYIDQDEFRRSLENSFDRNNFKQILNQLTKDFGRMHVDINGKPVEKYTHLIDFLDYRYDWKTHKYIVMCCTQAVMGIPFEILHNTIIANYGREMYISDLDPVSAQQYDRSMHLQVFIETPKDRTDDDFHIKATKNLRIFQFDPDQSQVITTALVGVILNITKDSCTMELHIKKCK